MSSEGVRRGFLHALGLSFPLSFLKDLRFYGALALGPLVVFLLKHGQGHPSFPKAALVVQQFLWVAFPEEFFFRGWLLPTLARHVPQKWGSLTLANILTAAIFALFHLLAHPLWWALGTFFPALIFGYFRERYASIWPAVFLHLFYNLSYFSL